jgi:putative transcriptional regulator
MLEEEAMSTISLRMMELRKRRRLSQRTLAAMAGVRPDTVSELERGISKGIQFETLARLCAALDCTPGELFELRLDAIDDHQVPVLGGSGEDEILRRRLRVEQRVVDGPSFVAELLREHSTGGKAAESGAAEQPQPDVLDQRSTPTGQSA